MTKYGRAVFGGIFFVGTTLFAQGVFAADTGILEEECHIQLNLGDAGCACVRERADAILNDMQQQLVIAMVTKDQAASSALRSEMTPDEMGAAAEFMMQTPGVCGGQTQ